jgi:hypothetical protein
MPVDPKQSEKPGRSRGALDAMKKAAVVAVVSVGCTQRVAARYVGCAPSTIRNEARRDAEFAARLRRAREDAEIYYLKQIRSAAGKAQYWRAAAWALERTLPERYARRDPDALTAEQVAALLASFAEIVVADIDNEELRKRIVKRLGALAAGLGRPVRRKDPGDES